MRLGRGLIAVVTFQIVYASVQFLQVPLLLSKWGSERYGVWLLLQIAQLAAARSDFGLAIATSKDVMLRLRRGDTDGAVRTYRAMLSSILLLQMLLFGAVLLIATLTGTSWGLSLPPGELVRAVCWMMLAGFMMTLIEALYAAYYATGRNALGMAIRTFGQVSWMVAISIAVLNGSDIGGTAFALFVGMSVPVLLAAGVLVASKSILRPALGFNFQFLKPLVAPSLTLATLPFAQIISLSVPRLLIVGIAGPALLAAFNAHRQMTRVISLVFGLSLAFEPMMTAARAINDRRRFLFLAIDCQLLVVGVAIFGAVGLAAVSALLFHYWTHGEIELSMKLFVPLALAAVFEATWRAVISALTAANEHVVAGLAYLTANVAGLALVAIVVQSAASQALVVSWGLSAIECATLIAVGLAFMHKTGLTIRTWTALLMQRIAGAVRILSAHLSRSSAY